MRPTPDAIANTSITTAHFRPVARSSRRNADRAGTTPPPSATFAARGLPDTTLAPPTSAANIADDPWIRKTSATSTTAAIWYATARNASRRPAAAEFSTRETRWDGKDGATKGAPPSRKSIAGARFRRQRPEAGSIGFPPGPSPQKAGPGPGVKRFQPIRLFRLESRNFPRKARSVLARSALNFLVDAPPQTSHEAPARCRGFFFMQVGASREGA